MKIVDIHTHILYDIDDGSPNCAMSLELIDTAYVQGVRGLFFTNHSFGMERGFQAYTERFEELRRLTAERHPDLSVYKGCEIACHRNRMSDTISNIRNNVFPTMNGTRYVLLEFVPSITNGMDEMEFCLRCALDNGYIPIIAHAERYAAIYDAPLDDLRRMKQLGCLVQINLYSVEQDKGTVGGGSRKALANLFLQNGLVDFAGTDTHRIDYKPAQAAIGAAAICREYGASYAEKILFGNAERLLNVQ